jgi:hypothetical protein
MERKIRIATVTALVGLLAVAAPVGASAAGPLLSGYGGPGTGEQAIIGSTLINGTHGGRGGSGGSSGGAGSGRLGSTGSGNQSEASRGGLAAGSSDGSQAARGGAASGGPGRSSANGRTGAGRGAASSSLKGASQAGQLAGSATSPPHAFVYPSSLDSRSGDSSALSVSITDIFLLFGITATLGVIGVFTVRLSRLQP